MPASRRRCSSGGPTSPRPNGRWRRPTPRSASRCRPYYPDITLNASINFVSSILANLLSIANAVWSLGPALAGTAIDGGGRAAQVEGARANYDNTVATYRQTVITAFQQVEDALVQQRILLEQEQAQATAVAAARLAEELAMNQYRAGTVPYTTVVQTQTAALAAELALLNVRLSRLTASANLVTALGGGWRDVELPPPVPIAERDEQATQEENLVAVLMAGYPSSSAAMASVHDWVTAEHARRCTNWHDAACGVADHRSRPSLGDARSRRAFRSPPAATRRATACTATAWRWSKGTGFTVRDVGKPDFRDHLRRATGATLKVPTLAERTAAAGGFIGLLQRLAGRRVFLDPDNHGHVYHRAGSFRAGRSQRRDPGRQP
jgi:hypothetical protein